VSAAAALLASPFPESYDVGEVASRTVRADRDLSVRDPDLTEREREKAYLGVTPVFILDDSVASVALAGVRSVFQRGRQLVASGAEEIPEAFADDFSAVFSRRGDDPEGGDLLERTLAQGFSTSLERAVTWLSLELLSLGIREEEEGLLQDYQGRNVEITRAGTGAAVVTYGSILTIAKAETLVAPRAGLLSVALDGADGALTVDLTLSVIRPNLVLDGAALELMRAEARASVPEARHQVRRGDVLVAAGERVDRLTRLKLDALARDVSYGMWLTRAFGLFLVFLALLWFAGAVSAVDGVKRSRAETALAAVILLLYLAAAWASVSLGRGLNRGFDFLENRTLFLAMPAPAAAMLAAVFLDRGRAAFVCFLGSLMAAAAAPVDTLAAFVYLAAGSLAAVPVLRHLSERGRFIPAAAATLAANSLVILGLNLASGSPRSAILLPELAAGCASALLSGVAASGLVPLIELLTGFTTNFKLMELGNLNRPLLRELMVTAPGTYHHSVIVGSMVEAAAEAVRANAHLARAGAYYHDIGKIKKPLYFIENQGAENRHDALTPTMSALLLVAHVKDGGEMAREAGLPQGIVDIVEQHHGTSLMSFFYHKAMENRGPNSPEINEMDFRYPGPKPAGKEAGLVMLADVCEAATRSLSEPTPRKIQELVKTLVNRLFDDGQLEASELTLKDLTEIKRVFVSILTGIYHHRVAYPSVGKEAERERQTRSQVVYGHISPEPSKRLAH
jgi:putative nucleotidyltransferase with HDIG domain